MCSHAMESVIFSSASLARSSWGFRILPRRVYSSVTLLEQPSGLWTRCIAGG